MCLQTLQKSFYMNNRIAGIIYIKGVKMDSEKQQATYRLKMIEKKMLLLGLYDAPAMVIIGLGLFSKFGHEPASLHPLLADANVVNSALAIAIPWALICAYQSVKLAKEASKLKNKHFIG